MHFCFFSFYLLPNVSNHTDSYRQLNQILPLPSQCTTVRGKTETQPLDITERPLAISQRPLRTVTALSDQSDPKKDQLHSSLVRKRSFPVGIRASISSQRVVVWSTVYPRVGSTPTPLRRPTRMALPHPSANPTFSSSIQASATI